VTRRMHKSNTHLADANWAVQEVPGVCGGYPTIRGTRIPVWVVVAMRAEGAGLDEIIAAYPHVERELIQGALDYYSLRPGRVDEDRKRNEASLSGLAQWKSDSAS
jgi:uncharacterized protein (DUF433 family)